MDNLSYYSESIETNNGNPAGISYFVGCIMVTVFILGLFENSTVIFAYIKTPKLRTVNNAFLIGLSLSDTGQTLFNIPLVIVSCFSRKWIFGHPACLYIGFITAFFGLTQITLLCIIALERYFIIVHQSRVLSASGTRAFVTILCCFVYGGCWALGPLVGWSEYKLVAGGMSCSINWSIPNDVYLSYTVSLFVCVWFLPLSVIIYCYIRIARVVYREKAMRTIRSSIKRKKTTREKYVSITVLIMICAFVVSWTPYSIVALMSVFGNIDHVPSEVYLAPAVFAKASIIWNPIIYIARHREFRHACKQILSRICICVSDDDTAANKNGKALEQNFTDNHNYSDNQYSLPLLQSTDIVIIPVSEIAKCTCDQTKEDRRESMLSNHTSIQEDASVSSEHEVLTIPCNALQGLPCHTPDTEEEDQRVTKLEKASCEPVSQCYTTLLSASKEKMNLQLFYTERAECVSNSDEKFTLGSKCHIKNSEENKRFNDTQNCYQIVKVKCICNKNCTNTKFEETSLLDDGLSGYILLKQFRRQRQRHFDTLKYHRFLESKDLKGRARTSL